MRPFVPAPHSVFAAALAAGALLAGTACVPGSPASPAGADGARPLLPDAGRFTGLAAEPRASAGNAFWEHWGDGRAELSGYRVRVRRYGEMREGELALVYVTEPHDRRTWIKDDDVEEPDRLNVMKLLSSLKFLTGIYPYSVTTSVFAPVDDFGGERFAPAKIVLSAHEWCGAVHHQVWPGDGRLRSLRLSYFAEEGETLDERPVPAGTLYEDALPLQLRELDGPFAGGGDWEGWLVPSLWTLRAGHRAVEPVQASIRRSEAEMDGVPTTRFALSYGDVTRTFDVEREPPRRLLGWSASDGEEARLIRSERLAYWRLNGPGDESWRASLGLATEGYAPPSGEGAP